MSGRLHGVAAEKLKKKTEMKASESFVARSYCSPNRTVTDMTPLTPAEALITLGAPGLYIVIWGLMWPSVRLSQDCKLHKRRDRSRLLLVSPPWLSAWHRAAFINIC
jgi:hypothetical protein